MPHQPQAAFAGYAHSLQFEWAYLQREIEIEGCLFVPLEDATNLNLLPALLEVPALPQDLLDLTLLPVSKGGLGALNPCREAALNKTTFLDSTSHLVEAILGQAEFKPDVHAATMEGRKLGAKTRKVGVYKEVIKDVESGYTDDQIQSVERASKAMNHWPTVVPNTENNTVLGRDKFWDMVLL
eukprot:10648050-Ditylum_brightwellii.AAC.1